MPHRLADLIINIIAVIMAILGIDNPAELLTWAITIGAAIFLIKRIFRIGSRRKAKQDDYWLNKAQARQEIRFENSLPPLQAEANPLKKTFREKRNERKGKSATGWIFNEETQLWEPPKNMKR